MLFGAVGLLLPSVTLLLAALFAMGVHSAFFGPIKYAILPQHLREKEVLGGTGLVEAGTYAAILGGTIVGGIIPPAAAAGMVLLVAPAGSARKRTRLNARYSCASRLPSSAGKK